jgi:hypothetical protein
VPLVVVLVRESRQAEDLQVVDDEHLDVAADVIEHRIALDGRRGRGDRGAVRRDEAVQRNADGACAGRRLEDHREVDDLVTCAPDADARAVPDGIRLRAAFRSAFVPHHLVAAFVRPDRRQSARGRRLRADQHRERGAARG